MTRTFRGSETAANKALAKLVSETLHERRVSVVRSLIAVTGSSDLSGIGPGPRRGAHHARAFCLDGRVHEESNGSSGRVIPGPNYAVDGHHSGLA